MSEVDDLKTCVVCKEEKPLSDFYFRKDRGIYRPNCKKCKPLNRMADIMKRVAEQTTKICKHCEVEKPISEYQKAGGGKWLQPYCKPCDAERKRKYNEENIDKVLSSRKEYYVGNKELITKKTKEYRCKNIEKVKARSKSYREKNRDEIIGRQREYGKKNRQEITKRRREKRESNKEYYQQRGRELRARRTPEQVEAKKKYDREYKIKNRDKYIAWREANIKNVREQRRIWGNKKAATDIIYRIKRNLRTRIRCALKPNNAYKTDTSENLLGCTIPFFKHYFESLFTDGMNWEKFMSADIEIDHIKPCAKFDLTKEEEQRKCFHYSNCQPLWWYDNNKKGATYNEQKVA